MKRKNRIGIIPAAGVAALAFGIPALSAAADWSDTWVGMRYGTSYREVANTNKIGKEIYQLQHVSGNSWGTNFVNVDMLSSDSKDPASAGFTGANAGGAQEVFVVYRYTLSMSKFSGSPVKFGPFRDVGLQAGFDYNSKDDNFGSRVRRPMAGPMFSVDVPGFWDVGVLWQAEHNHNGIVPLIGNPPGMTSNVVFKDTWRLATSWGIPIDSMGVPAKFAGFMNIVGAKGKDGFGTETKPETLLEAALMFDVGANSGKKGTFWLGVGYQYWKNKFGNDASKDASGGSVAHVPQLQFEVHF